MNRPKKIALISSRPQGTNVQLSDDLKNSEIKLLSFPEQGKFEDRAIVTLRNLLVVVGVCVSACLILPLLLWRREGLKSSGSGWRVLYFACLGLGFGFGGAFACFGILEGSFAPAFGPMPLMRRTGIGQMRVGRSASVRPRGALSSQRATSPSAVSSASRASSVLGSSCICLSS